MLCRLVSVENAFVDEWQVVLAAVVPPHSQIRITSADPTLAKRLLDLWARGRRVEVDLAVKDGDE